MCYIVIDIAVADYWTANDVTNSPAVTALEFGRVAAEGTVDQRWVAVLVVHTAASVTSRVSAESAVSH